MWYSYINNRQNRKGKKSGSTYNDKSYEWPEKYDNYKFVYTQ